MFWERSDSSLSDDTLKIIRGAKVDCNIVRKSIDRFFGGHLLFKVKTLNGGTFNRGFHIDTYTHDDEFVGEYLARFNVNPNPNLQSIHLEQWINNEAISRGFPTPKIIHVNTSRVDSSYPFQLVEWSNGISLRGQNEEIIQKVLAELGHELRVLHDRPIYNKYEALYGRVGLGVSYNWEDFCTSNCSKDLKYLVDNKIINHDDIVNVLYVLDGLFDERGLNIGAPSLLHGDLSYDNILINPKTNSLETVIDWEDAVFGDPIFELAGLATFHPIERHSCFIDSYYEGGKKPSDFEYRFWMYYLRIALAKTVHRHRFGYTTEVKPGYQNPDYRIQLAIDKLEKL